MGGDNTSDTSNGAAQAAATQQAIDQLNARFAQEAPQAPPPPQTRASYGGVAPATDNLGAKDPHADPFYRGTTPGGRAGYGVSGTDAPGGAGTAPNKPGGEQVPNFQQLHANDARPANQPYTPNPVGAQAEQQMAGQPGGRPGSSVPVDESNTQRVMKAISMRGQYTSPYTFLGFAAGAVTAPLTAKGISRGANALVDKGGFGSGFGRYWQENYDASKVGKADLIKSANQVTEADTNFARMVETETRAAANSADPIAQGLAKERLELLNRTITPSTVVDIKATSASRLESGGKALFSDEELGTIEGKYAAGVSRSAEAKAVEESMAKATPSMFKTIKAGLGGMLWDLGAVNADRFIAKSIGGENSLLHSYNTEQFLAPAALALSEGIVGKSVLGKVALLGGTIIGSRLIDGTTQAVGLGAPGWVNAPTGVMNWMDGLGVATGLAIAASAKNPYAKVAAVALGWGIPKFVHLLTDNGSSNLQRQYLDVTDKITSDHKSRSYGSLEDVTDTSKSLGQKQEDWLVGKIEQNRNTLTQQWGNMGPDQKLLAFRDDAGMSVGLGEDLLKEGTRIHKQGAAEYTLGGYEIDMGGRAMHYLISGKDSVERAAAMTQGIIDNNNDASKSKILVNGSSPSKSEVDDLNKYDADIKSDLAKILNQKHDCSAVLAQVVKNIPSSSDDWRQTYMLPTDKMIEHYLPRNSPAQAPETRQVIGKLYRDQAIAYMAFAQDKLNRGGDGQGAYDLLMDNPNNHNDIFPSGRQKAYNGAQGVLLMAAKFDPTAKDLPELQQMWKDLAVKAAQKAGQQLTNPDINILNYGGMAPRPKGQ
jgi:hypothetical protein